MGLEPTPGPWQGPVLPLYYGRPNQENSNTPANWRQDPRGVKITKGPAHTRVQRSLHCRASLNSDKKVGSADLQHPRGFYDGRLPLPLGKFGGLFPVCIHACKPLPVLVKHSHLPVLVLAPPIFPQLGAFPCGFGFGHGLNISMALRAHKYRLG
jgi:hypothetical protein